MRYYFVLVFSFFLISSSSIATEELKSISSDSFLATNPSPEREAIVNFIVHQFDKRREVGITQAELDSIWNNIEIRKKFYLARFQIVNQKLYADSFDPEAENYFQNIAEHFQKIINLYKINNLDLIVFIRDEIPKTEGSEIIKVPAFLMSKDTAKIEEKDMFLLPDSALIVSNWADLIKRIDNAKDLYPWDSKVNKIFWRGFFTGGSDDIDSPNVSKRLNLAIFSKLYPNLIDAKLTGYWTIIQDKDGLHKKSISHILFSSGLYDTNTIPVLYQTDKVKEEEHLKYKYLISLDGNTCAWSRPVWIMLSNSVLVKQETPRIQWFYSAIKPYIHYVPVQEDISDIFERIEWMKTHDSELQQISQNAQNFVKNNLMPEQIEAQTALILNEYSKLFKDEQIVVTLPTAESTLAIPEKKRKIKAEQEAEKNMPRKKKIIRFFRNLQERITNLWN